jgi:proline iminopeptidase
LIENAGRLAGVPGVLVNGRYDFQSPVGNAYELRRAWPQAELVVVDDAGHVPTGKIAREIVRATDRFR